MLKWLLMSIRPANKIFLTVVSWLRNQMLFYRPIKPAVSNNFFSTYCTEFLKLHYRDIVTFRTKNQKDEKLVIDSLQTSRFLLWRGKILTNHFQMSLWCNKHVPGQSANIFIAFQFFCNACLCVYPKRFYRGRGRVVVAFEIIYLFSIFKLFSVVKWLWINSIVFK